MKYITLIILLFSVSACNKKNNVTDKHEISLSLMQDGGGGVNYINNYEKSSESGSVSLKTGSVIESIIYFEYNGRWDSKGDAEVKINLKKVIPERNDEIWENRIKIKKGDSKSQIIFGDVELKIASN